MGEMFSFILSTIGGNVFILSPKWLCLQNGIYGFFIKDRLDHIIDRSKHMSLQTIMEGYLSVKVTCL